jgi:hypothetical protein
LPLAVASVVVPETVREEKLAPVPLLPLLVRTGEEPLPDVQSIN